MNEDFALVRREKPDQKLERHAFTNSAAPKQAKRLPIIDVKRDVIQDDSTPERLGYVLNIDCRFLTTHFLMRRTNTGWSSPK